MIGDYEEVVGMGLSEEGCFTELVNVLLAKEADFIYDGLSETEQQIWCIYELVAGAGSGGFQSYFHDTQGMYVNCTIDTLSIIGLDMAADILRRAVQVHTNDSDDADKSDEFLLLSEEFADLEPWYEKACNWCVMEMDRWLSETNGTWYSS